MLDAQHTQHDGNGEGKRKRPDCRFSENTDDAHLDFSFTAISSTGTRSDACFTLTCLSCFRAGLSRGRSSPPAAVIRFR